MSRFHINKHGVPAPCRAKPGNCPLGGDDQHFKTKEEAQAYADNINEKEHSLLPEVENNTYFNLDETEFKGLINKAVNVVLKAKDKQPRERIEGVVRSRSWEDKTLIIRDETDFNKMREINMSDVLEFEASKNPYYSDEYKKELRENKKAQRRFRFSEENLKNFENKFVKVKYDGKEFDGQVIGSQYYYEHDSGLINEHDSGLIIQNDKGEVKHIKNYRMQDLDVTGDTPMEHKTQLKIMSIYDEAIDDLDDYTGGSEYAPETSEVDPVNQAEKYFDAVIRKHSGENVDLKKYDFDWVEEVEDNQDSYMSLTNAYSRTAIEPEYGWDSSSDEAYYDDLSKAEDTNKFFEGRKEFIHDMVKKVQKVDWTQYGMNQKEGEIEALKFLKDGDLMGT